MAHPNTYRTDFTHPYRYACQSLNWENNDCEWSVRIPALRDAYAAVVFRQSHNLSVGMEDRSITFQLKPAHMADHLTVALLDRIEMRNGRVREERGIALPHSLGQHRIAERGDWAFYAVPLTHFDTDEGAFDWTAIRGVKIVRHTDGGPAYEVVLKHLAFREGEWTTAHRFASLR
jgi:hypothetical protein